MRIHFVILQELPVFISIVKDVFGKADLTTSAVGLKESFMQDILFVSLPVAPTASRKLLSPPKLAFVSELLKQQASKNHLISSPHWMTKVEQLFIQSQLKHGKSSVSLVYVWHPMSYIPSSLANFVFQQLLSFLVRFLVANSYNPVRLNASCSRKWF